MPILFQGFPGREYSEVVYHTLPLWVPWDCAACPRPHWLALLTGGTVGNQTRYLWLHSQLPKPRSYSAICNNYMAGRYKKAPSIMRIAVVVEFGKMPLFLFCFFKLEAKLLHGEIFELKCILSLLTPHARLSVPL